MFRVGVVLVIRMRKLRGKEIGMIRGGRGVL